MQTQHPTKSPAGKRAISFAVALAALVVVALVVMGGSALAQSASERFVVTGVIFVEGGKGLAWLQEPTFTKNKVIAVHPGDRVGPYRVTKILEDQVVLEGPNGTVSVPLAGGPGTSTAAVGSGAQRPNAANRSPVTAANRPEQVVVPRSDSRRNFPVTEFLGGNAPPGPTSKSNRGSQSPTASTAPRGSSTSDAGPSMTPAAVSSSSSATSGSGSSGSSGGDPVVIPRGDSRRNFPVADFFPPPK